MNNPPVLPCAVIFDWDNTLVDSWGAMAEAINAVHTRFGMPLWSLDEVKANCYRSAREVFPEWFGDRWQEASDIFYARFSAVQMQNLRPMEGSAALLAWLADKKIPCFVVSNKNGTFLRQEAIALKWDHYFTAIIGATDAAKDKPAREHPDHALALGGLTADTSVWFIGDTEIDMICARNAGCTPVFIGKEDFARRHKIDMWFCDLKDLLGLLSRT